MPLPNQHAPGLTINRIRVCVEQVVRVRFEDVFLLAAGRGRTLALQTLFLLVGFNLRPKLDMRTHA